MFSELLTWLDVLNFRNFWKIESWYSSNKKFKQLFQPRFSATETPSKLASTVCMKLIERTRVLSQSQTFVQFPPIYGPNTHHNVWRDIRLLLISALAMVLLKGKLKLLAGCFILVGSAMFGSTSTLVTRAGLP